MAETAGDFAQAPRREILRSEQQRIRVLAPLLLFIRCLTSIGLGPLAIRSDEQPVRAWRLP